MTSRRDFLKGSAALAAALAMPGLFSMDPRRAIATEGITPSPQWLDDYVAALDRPHFAPLNNVFDDLLDDDGNLCMLIYDVLRGQLLTGLKTEAPMPIASSFKGPVLFYFFDQVDASVWTSVPVPYWGEKFKENIPAQYQDAWSQHYSVLNDLFSTIVVSDNNSTGRLLTYVARQQGSDAPLALFNDWSHNVVGVSQISALGGWNNGVPAGYENTDLRFTRRTATLDHQQIQFNNLMTARDLGLYYIWWQSQMNEEARRVGEELLSWIWDDRRSNIEKLAYEYGGTSYSKNGSLSEAETGVYVVVTDGGILDLPDFGYYLIAVLAGDADSRTPTFFARIGDVVTGVYADEVKAYAAADDEDLEQIAFYEEYMLSMYPANTDISLDEWNYGFVKTEGIEAFRSPAETLPIRNPVISSSRFGVHLLMQGALVRYRPINAEWVELIPDSPKDNVQYKMGAPMFIRSRDLHPISTDYGKLIPYFTDSTVTADDKMVVIDIQRRELTLFEKEVAILKSPVVMNDVDTPRGGHVVTTKWFSCSMQPWAPGVPFTTYFHVDGFAIHGSPWQRWHKTVNSENIYGRTSAGCVNVPNWTVTLGEYTRPLDELVFRWLGGVVEPERKVYEYGTYEHPTVRIYVIDYPRDLNDYYRPPNMARRGTPWGPVIEQLENISLTAPDSFWETK